MQPLWKTVWSYLKKIKKMDLLYDPAIPLLGIYPKKPKTLIQMTICTHMLIAALFTTRGPVHEICAQVGSLGLGGDQG